MTTIVKKSFDELKAENDANQHNQMVKTLVGIMTKIENELFEMAAYREKLEKFKLRVEEVGNNPDAITAKTVEELRVESAAMPAKFENSRW